MGDWNTPSFSSIWKNLSKKKIMTKLCWFMKEINRSNSKNAKKSQICALILKNVDTMLLLNSLILTTVLIWAIKIHKPWTKFWLANHVQKTTQIFILQVYGEGYA